MTQQTNPLVPPHSVGPEYELHEITNDLDIQLKRPGYLQADYHFHIPRQPGDENFALHRGSNKLDPILATIKYHGYFAGELTDGAASPTSPWTEWEQSLTQARTTFTVPTGPLPDPNATKYRWKKTPRSKRTGLIKISPYATWELHEVTPSTIEAAGLGRTTRPMNINVAGPTLATLTFEPDTSSGAGKLKDKLLRRGKNGEDEDARQESKGLLTFQKQLEPRLQDVAIALLLALCHRDRQLGNKEELGPCIELKPPKNAKMYAGAAAGGLAFGGYGAASMMGFGVGMGGFAGGVGGDCGGGGGGGGGC
ncbi:hypothetical protein C1H76_5271 [Elsinoe australis]|uniref:Uncharacterized protein n=1 Tax=Elsinoe australis TaxID=40998 RepID=A0A4U7AWC1_9PEZI|nr:hypothetical protein C1H76_5271 [Elsinoe australis]